ncbi:MFS transporter [Rhodococcus opacus]|uniref:MFS transporter n=1 Tax=Rhodococcus opacus TaxID=37919 RepID=A0A2S8IGL4_RHOOP|nr:MFS transporter [Rhodococcus opacus]PQP13901.1 MFS transporter [Rhodococcus opacus]
MRADRDPGGGGHHAHQHGESAAEEAGDRWLTPGVLGVGAASLFSDSSPELVTSLFPTFLTTTLQAGPAALGAIDGTADALTGLAKLAGGPLAADPERRARFAAGGYLGTAVATAAIGLATAVWQVAVLRSLAWISRGVRSPARDMLLTSLTAETAYGRAFGVERAGDNADAIIGPLAASALVAVLGVRETILLSLIPGMLAAAAILVAAREARTAVAHPVGRRTLHLHLRELRAAGFARTLTPVGMFELGNVATTLLILRATDLLHTAGTDLTAATSVAILLYVAHNAAATACSLVAGRLSDRIGPRWVFAGSGVVYVAGYLIFAAGPHSWVWLLAGFVLAGIGIGAAETAESTAVARTLPERVRGNGFGVLGLVQSFGDMGSTVVAGILWSALSPLVAFGYAAAWMLACVLCSPLLRPTSPPSTPIP